MALRGFVFVLFLCCLDLTIARSCYYSSCGYFETCCSDKVCRRRCYSCSSDSHCGTGEECCSGSCKTTCRTRSCLYDFQCGTGKECCSGSCKTSCADVGLIAGIVVGNILFFGGIIAVAAFFCCKSAPCYRHRQNGRVVAIAQVPAQPAMQTARHISQVQHPTNNPAMPVGFHQPPPQYTPVAYQSKNPPGTATAVADN